MNITSFHIPYVPESLYLHYPLCRHICSYCDFNVYAAGKFEGGFARDWAAAIFRQLRALQILRGSSLKTLYLGGGTPSLMSLEEVGLVFEGLSEFFVLDPETEVTIECNPETLSETYLEGLQRAGVNRLSIGIQTSIPEQLRRLERLATFEHIHESILAAKKIFENFSLDLMIGIPDQTMESLERDLEFLIKADPPHISIYLLTLGDHQRMLQRKAIRDRIAPAELAAQMYLRVCSVLAERGYEHYEVSNFAKTGFRSRHNSNYWNIDSQYLGLGAGAHGYVRARDGTRLRYETVKDPQAWINSETGVEICEPLSLAQTKMEELYLKLRTRTPVSELELNRAVIPALASEGYIERNSAGEVVVTEAGWLLMEPVAEKLIP